MKFNYSILLSLLFIATQNSWSMQPQADPQNQDLMEEFLATPIRKQNRKHTASLQPQADAEYQTLTKEFLATPARKPNGKHTTSLQPQVDPQNQDIKEFLAARYKKIIINGQWQKRIIG